MKQAGTQSENRLGRVIIERPRLMRLVEESSAKTIVLAAPAGYGKTTLARQIIKGRSRSFVVPSPLSNGVAQVMANEIVASLDARDGNLLTLHPAQDVPTLARQLARVLEDHRVEFLVIEDLHEVRGTPAEALVDLLRRLGNFRALVTTRVRPRWASSRAEAYGSVLVVDRSLMAFSDDEVELLAASAGTPRTLALASMAQGWPLALGLTTVTDATPPRAVEGPLLAKFLADEVLSALSSPATKEVELAALFTTLDDDLGRALVGRRYEPFVSEARESGLCSTLENEIALHPLLREHVLDRARAQNRHDSNVATAARALRALGRLEDAIRLISANARRDLVSEILSAIEFHVFRALSHSALTELAPLCRGNPGCTPWLLDLIEAEVALRDGSYGEAFSLSERALVEADENAQPCLRITAGRSAFAAWDMESAVQHFKIGQSLALVDADQRDAAWGLALACIFGEIDDLRDAVHSLFVRRNSSALDLVRWSIAHLAQLRLGDGVREIGWIERSLEAASSLSDPGARTSFCTSYSYYQAVRAEYERGLEIARETLNYARSAGLAFVVPHAQWNIALCSTGLRRFAEGEKYLRQVEQHGSRVGDRYLIANAAILRARRLLMLQEISHAEDVASSAISSAPSKALKAELIAAACVAQAIEGKSLRPVPDAEVANWPIEARTLLSLAHGIASLRDSGLEANMIQAIQLCRDLGAWDSFVCVARAFPDAIRIGVMHADLAPHIAAVLRRSGDSRLIHPYVGRSQTARARGESLTPREIEVLELLRSGLKNRDIARALFISETTVKAHARHILAKLDATSRTQAVLREI